MTAFLYSITSLRHVANNNLETHNYSQTFCVCLESRVERLGKKLSNGNKENTRANVTMIRTVLDSDISTNTMICSTVHHIPATREKNPVSDHNQIHGEHKYTAYVTSCSLTMVHQPSP